MTDKPIKVKDKNKRFLPRVKVGGLWKRQTEDGQDFLVGELQFARIMIFVNEDKMKPGANPRSPDFMMYVGQGLPKAAKKKKK